MIFVIGFLLGVVSSSVFSVVNQSRRKHIIESLRRYGPSRALGLGDWWNIYTLLHGLEQEGVITSTWGDPPAGSHRAPRVYALRGDIL